MHWWFFCNVDNFIPKHPQTQKLHLHEQYVEACTSYIEYLEQAIEYEVRIITNKQIIENLFNVFVTHHLFSKEDKKMYGEIKTSLHAKKIKIACGFMNQFGSPENTAIHNNKFLNEFLNENNNINFKLLLEKYKIMREAKEILKDALDDKHTFIIKTRNFEKHLFQNKNVLLTRRDTAFTTFLKGLGVAAGFLFGFGVGGIYAYQSFFGKRATEGKKLLNKISLAPL